jgi:Lrp/AsnC family transcriptional regulator, regulator for asnA, asnC and gidA
MDKIDKKILNILQDDCTISYQKIAEKLQVGASTIHYRIQKLIKQNIIIHFSVILNPEKVGFNNTAVIGLNVDPMKMYETAEHLASFEEVQSVATASGDHDIILQIISKDGKHLWRFINDHIKTIDGVDKKIHVSSFLDIYKRSHIIRL